MNQEIPFSRRVIGRAQRVSKALGVGFLEHVYANALAIEMESEDINFEKERTLAVYYGNQEVGRYVADFVVERDLILELKALQNLNPDHEAQVLNYLAATRAPVGLLINFGSSRLQVKRLVRNHDDSNPI